VTAAPVLGLAAVVLYLGARLFGARAEIADLLLQNARLKRRLERGAR
jgi:hypothetical protein